MSQIVTIVGNLASDPELKFTSNAKAQARFAVATSERYKNDKGEWESRNLTYWNVIAWERMAENIVDTLKKGDKVIVYGKAYTQSWEDKNTGEKRSKMEVQAIEVAPGLSRATARIERNAQDPNKPTYAEKKDLPWEGPAKAVEVGASGGWGKSSYEDDVPPF